eukprot:TRINITY_DN25462_c0_g1_i1.p1 TRINITY_DN25462_c0_g1~~TRINITY_DN25462_c0_g1_i1.p1  ORF type:complete len:629 (-),score=105.90 TRINITY_DN25462_c0_g1_i1:85-1920(-)
MSIFEEDQATLRRLIEETLKTEFRSQTHELTKMFQERRAQEFAEELKVLRSSVLTQSGKPVDLQVGWDQVPPPASQRGNLLRDEKDTIHLAADLASWRAKERSAAATPNLQDAESPPPEKDVPGMVTVIPGMPSVDVSEDASFQSPQARESISKDFQRRGGPRTSRSSFMETAFGLEQEGVPVLPVSGLGAGNGNEEEEDEFSLEPVDREQIGFLRFYLTTYVTHTRAFTTFIMTCIFLNAVSMGVQADWIIGNPCYEPPCTPTPVVFTVIESLFAVVFTTELLLRIFAERQRFFMGPGRWWNVFDTFIVTLQLFELLAGAIVGEEQMEQSNLGFIRVLRVVRIFKVMRLVRLIRFIQELRTMVLAILSSLRSLGWALILLFFTMYVTGVYIGQALAEAVQENPQILKKEPALLEYYGTLLQTVVTLYQAMTGGEDWNQLLKPLQNEISAFMVILFVLYIAFTVMLMMNVITGIFVDSALVTSRRERVQTTQRLLQDIFQSADCNGDGRVSRDEFFGKLGTPDMSKLFRSLGVHEGDVLDLFTMMSSTDTHGSIDANEFIDGFMHLQGEASAIDMVTIMYGQKQLFIQLKDEMKEVRETLDRQCLHRLPTL